MPYKNIEDRKARQRQYYAEHRDEVRAYWNNWHKQDRLKNPDKVRQQVRKATLKMHYGMSTEEYQQMLLKQNGVCAICHKPDTRQLSVDHNHCTKRIRGLLCRDCNLTIGNCKEDILILKSAIRYLRSHNE